MLSFMAPPLGIETRLDASLAQGRILSRPFTSDCWRDSRYLIVAFVTGTVGFTFIVSAVSTAAGLSVLIIGLPTAVLVAHFDRWWCRFERLRAGAGRITRWLSVLSDRQTWFDALWMFLAFPVSVVGFVVAVTFWVGVPALLTLPIYAWSLPGSIHDHVVLWSIAGPFLAIVAAVIGRGWCAGSLLPTPTSPPSRSDPTAPRCWSGACRRCRRRAPVPWMPRPRSCNASSATSTTGPRRGWWPWPWTSVWPSSASRRPTPRPRGSTWPARGGRPARQWPSCATWCAGSGRASSTIGGSTRR